MVIVYDLFFGANEDLIEKIQLFLTSICLSEVRGKSNFREYQANAKKDGLVRKPIGAPIFAK